MLTGQAKTDYQREYMRRRRSNKPKSNKRPEPVRPKAIQQAACKYCGLPEDQPSNGQCSRHPVA